MKIGDIGLSLASRASAAAPSAALPGAADAFDSVFKKAGASAEQAREAARQLVSIALIQPVLTKAHEDPFKTEMFHGGQGEAMFQQQLDTILADRITHRANFPLVDAVYQQITRQQTKVDQQA
ncbi:MAG: rod-binding protein [Phycisphaeraceae bacterium]